MCVWRGRVWAGCGRCWWLGGVRLVGLLVGLVLGVCCGGVGVAVAGVTHSLVSSCTGAGTAAGRFVLPRGVAVDEGSEEVFVMDRQGDPPGVERFSVAGVCVRSWKRSMEGARSLVMMSRWMAGWGGCSSRIQTTVWWMCSNWVWGNTCCFLLRGWGPPQSTFSGGVAVAGGVLYVSNDVDNTVEEFSASGGGKRIGGVLSGTVWA